jgi:hypothetical protein
MPFCCGKRSTDICVVLGSEQSRPPHHLGGAHKHGATYSSHRAPSTYSFGKERVLARLGWAGVIDYASGFFKPAASHQPASPFPRNEGLLGQAPRAVTLIGIVGILSFLGCVASPLEHQIQARQAVIGTTKDHVLSCAGQPIQEIPTTQGTVLRYYSRNCPPG